MFNIPISPEKADRLISMLGLPAAARVLDVGCGEGEFLIRVIEATGASGLGIDNDSAAIAAARERARGRVSESLCEFRLCDAEAEPLAEAAFDLAICLGSTHAFGMGDVAYPNALERLTRVLRPGGMLLIGEGYWKQPPAPQYLTLIGDPVGIYRDHAQNIAFAEEQGLIPLYAAVSSDDEWDHFEWSHRMRIEREAALRPNGPDSAQSLKQSRGWRDGYLRWGRVTMGFGFYLFMKPPAEVRNAE